jgi:N-acetylmuramic acid 6-phosphate (MurNAc-6-P) etherase
MTSTNTDERRAPRRRAALWPRALPLAAPVAFALLFLDLPRTAARIQEQAAPAPAETSLLRFLGIEASAESVDYVQNKAPFQLQDLLTEQRHPATWSLGERVRKDVAAGLGMIVAVDEDVAAKVRELASDPALIEQMARAFERAIIEGRTIYIYGCGATGRLAKQMESGLWRPFWRRAAADAKAGPKLAARFGAAVGERLIGEMTGADRALISSLEGFEDLQLIGRLQLGDRGIGKGDVVVCVTEGGETSSVIGTVLAARGQWGDADGAAAAESRRSLYFIYNNPDDKLLPFERSRRVLREPGITKLNLTTGPQAITGSTRMQATTIETWVVGTALAAALDGALRTVLAPKEMTRLGFGLEPAPLRDRLERFAAVRDGVAKAVPTLAALTALEAETYEAGRYATYFAGDGLITVFIDGTERSPTFRLFPLDTVDEPARKCWFQVWTPAADRGAAWTAFLGRPFRGLAPELYRKPFEEEIEDPYLRTAALESLKRAGDDQREKYDFAFAEPNIGRRGPKPDDLGVAIVVGEEAERLAEEGSPFGAFLRLLAERKARPALVLAGVDGGDAAALRKKLVRKGAWPEAAPWVQLGPRGANDPLGLDAQVALKMALNAHSTAVMARLGKVVGNTMVNVSPSNLKLIGRATNLILMHVNDAIARPEWVRLYGRRKPISYGEANAVLFDAIAYLKTKRKEAGQAAEVAFSIIRILESLRRKSPVPPEEALRLVVDTGLAAYLENGAQPAR